MLLSLDCLISRPRLCCGAYSLCWLTSTASGVYVLGDCTAQSIIEKKKKRRRPATQMCLLWAERALCPADTRRQELGCTCRKNIAAACWGRTKKKRREGAARRKCIKVLFTLPLSLCPSPGRYVSQSTMAKLQWSTMLQRLSPAPIFTSAAWQWDPERLWGRDQGR